MGAPLARPVGMWDHAVSKVVAMLASVKSVSQTYAGFDRFGRVVDQRWVTTGQNPVDKDRFQYGYDHASNRTYRYNSRFGGRHT
jgi:hypothetical protein